MKTLLSGGVVVTCDDEHAVYMSGDVLIDDDRIGFAGPAYIGEYDSRISMHGRLVMPGLINTHTHSSMSLFRSLSDDVDLTVFLEQRVWPRELHLTGKDVYAGSALAAAEMLKSGVTTYVDMYFWEDYLLQAALDAGVRAIITPTILNAPVWERTRGTWEQQLAQGIDFCRLHQGEAGRIHTGLGPHAPYTVPIEALDQIAAEARGLDLPVNIHLVETARERNEFNNRYGQSTVAELQDRGFFEGKVIAVHNVWLDPGDVDVYAEKAVGAVHCPQSNAKLGAGVAPLAQMLAARVNVGLGTDGAATNNNLNLWEEMRLAPLLAKAVAHDPTPVLTSEALWMATSMGARAVHLPDVGVVRAGAKADLIAVRLDDTTAVPIFGPETYIDHLVYSMGRECVDSVWVNGRRVVKSGEVLTVDEDEVRRQAQQVAIDVLDRVSI